MACKVAPIDVISLRLVSTTHVGEARPVPGVPAAVTIITSMGLVGNTNRKRTMNAVMSPSQSEEIRFHFLAASSVPEHELESGAAMHGAP